MSNIEIKKNIASAEVSFYKIGGCCDYFFEAKNENDIAEAKKFATQNNIKLFIVEDNNFVVDQKGFNGLLVLKNNNIEQKFLFKDVPYSPEVIEKLKNKGVDVDKINFEKKPIPADFFIAELGLAGKTIGGFKISESNENILEKIKEDASFDDFMQIVSYIKQQVRDGLLTQLEEKFIYIY